MTDLALFVRAIHLGALTLLVGSFAFPPLVSRPAFRAAGPEGAPDSERFDWLLLRIAGWSLLVAFLSGIAWLWVQTAIVTGGPLTRASSLDAIGRLLTKTQFGQVWGLRLGLMAVLGALLLLRERELDDRDRRALGLEGAVFGAVTMAALAWAGHAAATEAGARLIHLAADALHLLAAGVWLGGLVPLFLLLGRARRSPSASWTSAAREATRRFSLLGLAAVTSLILTGVVNGWILVGGVAPLVGTPYGRLLLLKLGLLLPLIAIAAVNLLRLRPRLLAASTSGAAETIGNLVRRLRQNAIAEACLGATILLIVGALGVTPPARHLQPTWPFTFRLSWEASRELPGVQSWVLAGSLFALWGLTMLGYAGFRRLRPRWVLPMGLAVAAYGAWLALSPLAVDAYPTTYLRPAVPYAALSIAKGAHLYQQHCATCHGASGYGDGPAARGLAREPADLTAKHTADHTAGDIFWWVTHGIENSPMPGFGDRLSPEERWDLINFLRALSSAERARALAPLVEPEPWLVAPDFTLGIGVGRGETLKDNRGWAMVHLVLFTLPGSLHRLEDLDRAWGEIGLTGARILAVPMRDAEQVYRRLGPRAANFPIAVDGNQEIVETYGLFRRTLAAQGAPPGPPHMEFLIDRQGYIRARWIPGEGRGWAEIPRLLKEIERLDKETPRAPAPDEHVH